MTERALIRLWGLTLLADNREEKKNWKKIKTVRYRRESPKVSRFTVFFFFLRLKPCRVYTLARTRAFAVSGYRVRVVHRVSRGGIERVRVHNMFARVPRTGCRSLLNRLPRYPAFTFYTYVLCVFEQCAIGGHDR
jgi:hypothetical protein